MNDKHSRRVAATIQHSSAGYTTNCRAYVVAKIIFVLQGGWFANPDEASQALFQDCAVMNLRVTVGVREPFGYGEGEGGGKAFAQWPCASARLPCASVSNTCSRTKARQCNLTKEI